MDGSLADRLQKRIGDVCIGHRRSVSPAAMQRLVGLEFDGWSRCAQVFVGLPWSELAPMAMSEIESQPELTICRGASVDRVHLDDRSWVDVVSGFVRDPITELDTLIATTPWRQREVLRYDHYVAERRMSSGLRKDSQPLLRHTTMHLASKYRVDLDGVAAILYRDGHDFQGLHSDREMKWLDETLVAIVVLGERRPFVFRERTRWDHAVDRVPSGTDPKDVVLMPGEGDIIVMGGRCQRDWMHGVPEHDTPKPRLSLTWRWTSRRGKPDTAPTYYDGRHFSEGARQPGSRTRRSVS